jgi:hypothetical protein
MPIKKASPDDDDEVFSNVFILYIEAFYRNILIDIYF